MYSILYLFENDVAVLLGFPSGMCLLLCNALGNPKRAGDTDCITHRIKKRKT